MTNQKLSFWIRYLIWVKFYSINYTNPEKLTRKLNPCLSCIFMTAKFPKQQQNDRHMLIYSAVVVSKCPALFTDWNLIYINVEANILYFLGLYSLIQPYPKCIL